VTVRVNLFVPALTPGARRGLVGAGDGLDDPGREAVLRRAHPWPGELVATCAPERACLETAALLGLDAAVDPRVRDWDLGAWAGRSLTEIATTSPQDLEHWSTDPDFAQHGGESLQQLRSRVTNWLDRLETEGPPRLVTVAPTAVVRAILVSVLNAPNATFWRLDLEPMTSVHVSLRPGRRAVRWSAD
jgi:broad specificity phosphatase PhoE